MFHALTSFFVAILESLAVGSSPKPGRMAKIRISSGRSSVVMYGNHSSQVPHGSLVMLKLGYGTNLRVVFDSSWCSVKQKASSTLDWLSVLRSRTKNLSQLGADAPEVQTGRRMKSNVTSYPSTWMKSLLKWYLLVI